MLRMNKRRRILPVIAASLGILFSCKQPDVNNQKDAAVHSQPDSAANHSVPAVIDTALSVVQMDSVLCRQATAMFELPPDELNADSSTRQDVFIQSLKKALTAQKTWQYDFPGLQKKEIKVIHSADGSLRLFSWLSPGSGTMLSVQHVFQLQQPGHLLRSFTMDELYKEEDRAEGMPSPWFTGIYKLAKSPDTCYLLVGEGQMSGTEPYRVVHNLTISQGKPGIDRKIFNTGKQLASEIYVGISLPAEPTGKENLDIPPIQYNTTTQEIIFPETREGRQNTSLTGNMKRIKFNGQVFQ